MTIVTDKPAGATAQQALADVYGITGVQIAELDARLARAAARGSDPATSIDAAMIGTLTAAILAIGVEHRDCPLDWCRTCWYLRDSLAALAAYDMRLDGGAA